MTDLRISKSRSAIVEAGISVLLDNPSAGMSDIAAAAGIGRATLYRHYATRDELIRDLARLCLEETDELIAPIKGVLTGRQALEASIDIIVPQANRYRFLMSLLQITANDRTVRKIYKRQLDELSSVFEEAKQEGDIRSDLPTSWLVAQYDAMLNSAWYMIQAGELSSKEAADLFKVSFFEGCAPN